MNFFGTSFLSRTLFTEHLIHENSLDKNGFKEWVFHPGMLFNASDKWWGNQTKRNTPHEGLDLCLYGDRHGKIRRFDETTKIPAIYDGIVVGIVDDFLGRTIILEHDLSDHNNNRFCTIYAHINPLKSVHPGKYVKEGAVIATITEPLNSKVKTLSHLHISIGWASESISYDKFDWKTIGTSNTLNLVNPLYIVHRHSRVLNRISSMSELLHQLP